MKMFRILLSVATMLTAAPAWAADSEADTKPVTTMKEVVVTATRSEAILEKVGGSSITVISADDIERKNQSTVEEVLKGVPGLDIKANGGPGTRTSVFMRGADNKNTLILIDGIMFNDPSQANRAANLGSLTTDNIERIEIVRGPMSVLYGSNATAGVINIITKKGSDKPSIHAGIEGGSYETWKIYGGSAGKVKKLDYSVSASRTETSGFSTANDDNNLIAHDGNTSEEDGWQNTTITTNLGLEITPDFKITTVVRYLDSTVELDDYNYGTGSLGDRIGGWPLYAPEPNGLKERRAESKQLFAKINLHNSFADDKLSSDLSVQSANHDRDSFDNDGLPSYDYDGKSREVTWQGGIRLHESNLVTIGVGHLREEMESAAESIDNKNAETISYWLQDQIIIGNFDIVVGGRLDDHDKFGSEFTYRIAPAYTIDASQTTIKANYATGFRAPSLYELYSSYGNEDLEAEKNTGWDIGAEQELLSGQLKLGLTYFEMTFEDRIAYDFALWKYAQQPGDTKTKGVETVIGYTPTDSLTLHLTYTYNETEDPDGERLKRRPMNKVYLNAQYKFIEKASISMDLHLVGERDSISSATDINGNPVDTLDSYTVVNLSTRYELNDSLEVYGRIDNLFDEKYEEAWSYATPGLSAYVGIKFRN